MCCPVWLGIWVFWTSWLRNCKNRQSRKIGQKGEVKGLRAKYEEHHEIAITDEAIEAAVKLSSRYINDRFLPDKAIDLMDEAASRVRMAAVPMSEELKSIEEKITALGKEKASAIAMVVLCLSSFVGFFAGANLAWSPIIVGFFKIITNNV